MPVCARIVLAPALLAAAAAAHAEPTALVVEFHNASLGRYFLTTDPVEAAALDASSGWARTGGQFSAWARPGDAPNLQAVCRFYVPGAQSHFFTADDAACDAGASTPGWQFEGVAFYAEGTENGACSRDSTPVYVANLDTGAGLLTQRFTVDYTAWMRSGPGFSADGVAMCAPLSSGERRADAMRLLRQASFGPSPAEVDRAAALGPAAWVAEQLATRPTAYPEYPWVPANRAATCVDDRTLPVRADSYCARDNYTLFPLQLAFFRDALTQPDQLRGRVAFALSQIMVTSGVSNPRNYAMREYQQTLRERALGNYYDLLLAVTLSPNMGDYLDMANNNKANAATGTQPNENYAREIMQLFSVGLYLLNPDGTRRLDRTGQPIPTYDQDVIEGFAHVFTGWTYAPIAGNPSRVNNPRNYLGTMVPAPVQHDFGEKELLGGVIAPAGQSMERDLAFAHRNIFSHPNVGPFIGRQLIQKLVTSEPSPGYVARVAAIFADNGVGQRGDLGAVVRAILLDPEARGARKIDGRYGKLAEPILFLTGVARAFGASSDGLYFRNASNTLGQFPFYAPSVFNFYPPDYIVPGTDLVGPEFGVQTAATAIARANAANGLLFSNGILPDPSLYGASGTMLSLAPYQALAASPPALVDRLDRDLLGSTMSPAMRTAILGAVAAVPASDGLNRARTAAYLVVASPQYQVQR
jgi:uncharacterized protein (DUF1800 family)